MENTSSGGDFIPESWSYPIAAQSLGISEERVREIVAEHGWEPIHRALAALKAEEAVREFDAESIARLFDLSLAEVEVIGRETGYTAARKKADELEADFVSRLREHMTEVERSIGFGVHFDQGSIVRERGSE